MVLGMPTRSRTSPIVDAEAQSPSKGRAAPRAKARRKPVEPAGLTDGVKEFLRIATDAHRAVNRQLKQFSRRTRLTQRGLHILGLVADGLDRPGLLIEHFDVLPSTITTETDKLVAAGLLVRKAHPSDRRIVHLELTERGRGLEREAMALINAMFEPRLGKLDPEQLALCLDAMRRVVYPVDPAPRKGRLRAVTSPRDSTRT
jgi:DNA-binding MarR family transcriptional regulator